MERNKPTGEEIKELAEREKDYATFAERMEILMQSPGFANFARQQIDQYCQIILKPTENSDGENILFDLGLIDDGNLKSFSREQIKVINFGYLAIIHDFAIRVPTELIPAEYKYFCRPTYEALKRLKQFRGIKVRFTAILDGLDAEWTRQASGSGSPNSEQKLILEGYELGERLFLEGSRRKTNRGIFDYLVQGDHESVAGLTFSAWEKRLSRARRAGVVGGIGNPIRIDSKKSFADLKSISGRFDKGDNS